MPADDLAQFIQEYHRSVEAVVRGDGEPQKPLWSHRDDATLANPLGPPARGWDQIERALDYAVSQLRDGEVISVELISQYVTQDLAYSVEIERARARIGGDDEFVTTSLRVTTIFRREVDGWRVVHRHADPITTPRPISSIAQS